MEKKLYSTWRNMLSRCYNPNANRYDCYGGRGITVCREWREDFQAFYSWAICSGYADDKRLEREDVNRDFSPENCRWVAPEEQNKNTRRNRLIEHAGEKKTAAEWARLYGVDRCVFANRIRRGWTFEQAIEPARDYKIYTRSGNYVQ